MRLLSPWVRYRELESIRICKLKRHRAPWQWLWTVIQLETCRGGAICERSDVLRGVEPHAKTDSLAAILPFREIILPESDDCGACLHSDKPERSRVIHPVNDLEAESDRIEVNALLNIRARKRDVEFLYVYCRSRHVSLVKNWMCLYKYRDPLNVVRVATRKYHKVGGISTRELPAELMWLNGGRPDPSNLPQPSDPQSGICLACRAS